MHPHSTQLPLSPVSEEWQPIPGWESYEASSLGRVRRARPGHSTWVGRILTPQVWPTGYHGVVLPIPHRRMRLAPVHRLVAAAFLGPCPPGYQVHHKDRKRANNSVENLEYVTSRANAGLRDGYQLSVEIVGEIRRSSDSLRSLARRYGVHPKTVWEAKTGRGWASI
jgi:hypothetical protein